MLTNRQRLELATRLEAQLKTETDPARRERLRKQVHNMRQLVKMRGLQDEEPVGEAWAKRRPRKARCVNSAWSSNGQFSGVGQFELPTS